MASCSGARWHPLTRAPAKANPAAFRKSRRLGPSPAAVLVSDMGPSPGSMVAGGAVVGRTDRPARHPVFLGLAVAPDAPPHRQALGLPHALHGLHRAVTVL